MMYDVYISLWMYCVYCYTHIIVITIKSDIECLLQTLL